MGLFDWATGLFPKAPPPAQLSFNAPPGARAFGTGKLVEEMTDADVRESTELLWKMGEDEGLIKAWEIDGALDYRSTLLEIALDGMEAETRELLPRIPEALLRCQVLPVTNAEWQRRADNPPGPHQRTISLLAVTRDELEQIPGIRIYASKSSKKETGKCYYRGCVEVDCNYGEDAGTFLAKTNKITRLVVLGEDLTADFEQRTGDGTFTPQQWVEQVLRPMVLKEEPESFLK
ncbi:hypothetical protein [Cyanobium sp. HWJ4-Hawea]|uniref:hypothetical protein n=1 Tax=Cyanobium sp. HWJ4-Hawea TaxID=2823713 RepID=UPI0020CC9B10|nr:hypothetical protein [Cyanobium sp. HWJ4-Hawea]